MWLNEAKNYHGEAIGQGNSNRGAITVSDIADAAHLLSRFSP